MKLKFCNKFWYLILDSFILCKGLKQLILFSATEEPAVSRRFTVWTIFISWETPLCFHLFRWRPAQLS